MGRESASHESRVNGNGVYGDGVNGDGVYGNGVYGDGVYGNGVYGDGVQAGSLRPRERRRRRPTHQRMPTQNPGRPVRQSIPGDILSGAVSICRGLRVTLANFFRRKATVNYPFPDPALNYRPRDGYRGDFALLTDPETERLKCTACMSCVRICPDRCIHVEGEGKGKDRRPVGFYIDIGLCMFCHLCVEACPFDALTMTPDYEQAADDPRRLIRTLEDLTERGRDYTHVLRVQTAVAEPAQEAEPTP